MVSKVIVKINSSVEDACLTPWWYWLTKNKEDDHAKPQCFHSCKPFYLGKSVEINLLIIHVKATILEEV